MSSSKKPVNLYLTRLTPALWAQFYSWYEKRNEDHRPVIPNHGVWVVSDRFIDVEVPGAGPMKSPELVAGCCVYPADGPYCVVEFVSTNPSLPHRMVHMACERLGQALSTYGAMVGKIMLTFPKHKGVKRMLAKLGYSPVKPEVEVKWGPIFVALGSYSGKKTELTSAAATMDSANAAE